MGVCEEYAECVMELERCVKHLKRFSERLHDIGCDAISSDSIFGIEEAADQLQQEIENKIKKVHDEKI